MSNRMLHPRWCAPGCQVNADHPARSHVSRPIMISADGQEVINLRLVLSMAHTPMGAPLLVMLETYDTDPEARQPAGAFPLSIRQAGNLSRGITGLLRLARHTTWCDQRCRARMHRCSRIWSKLSEDCPTRRSRSSFRRVGCPTCPSRRRTTSEPAIAVPDR